MQQPGPISLPENGGNTPGLMYILSAHPAGSKLHPPSPAASHDLRPRRARYPADSQQRSAPQTGV